MRARFSDAIGDSVPGVLNLMTFNKQGRFSTLAVAIVAAQRDVHGTLQHRSADYWPRHTYQCDTEFSWVRNKDKELLEWVAIATEYIKRIAKLCC